MNECAPKDVLNQFELTEGGHMAHLDHATTQGQGMNGSDEVAWPNSSAAQMFPRAPFSLFFLLVCLFNDSGPVTVGPQCWKAHVPKAVQGRELALPFH